MEIREQMCTTLNSMTEALNDRYLGLPANVGLDKTDCFTYLIDRIVKKISGWKEKLLSAGGKEILSKRLFKPYPPMECRSLKFLKKL